MNSIEKLKQLTYDLPALVLYEDDSHIEYDSIDGTVIGFALLNKPEVAVQKSILSNGSKFPLHVHSNEVEHLIVYEGELIVTINEKERIIGAGDAIKINKGEIHNVIAKGTVKLIAVSVPRIEGYPNVKK